MTPHYYKDDSIFDNIKLDHNTPNPYNLLNHLLEIC